MAEIIKEVPLQYFYNQRQIIKKEKYEDFSLIEELNNKEFLAIDFSIMDGGRGYKNAKLIESSYVGAPKEGHYQTQLDSIFIKQ